MTIFISILLFAGTTKAQDPSKVDSLREAATESASDSLAIEQLIALAEANARGNRMLADTLLYFALTDYEPTDRQRAYLLSMRGQLAMVAGQYFRARQEIEKAEQVLNGKSHLSDIHLRNLNILGLLHYYQGEYDEGLSIFFERLSLSEASGDLGIQLRTLNNIGICYERLSANENALKYYEQALSILSEATYEELDLSNDDQRKYYQASINGNTGNILFNLKEYEEALLNYQLSFEVAERIDNKVLQADEASNLGRVHGVLGNHEQAELYHRTAIELSRELNEPQRVIVTTLNLAENLSRRGQYKQALNHLKTVEALADSKSIKEHSSQIYRELKRAQLALGNHEEALIYADKLSQAKDSLYASEQVKITEELNAKYQAAERDIELADQRFQITQQKAQRNLLMFGLASLLLFGFFIWYRSQVQRQKVDQTLQLQQQKIENLEQEKKILAMDLMMQGQEEERKRIAQDLHDGLGGLLSSVRSKVSIIQTQVADLEKIDLVTETEALVQKACDEVRRISHDMMPASLISLGLNDAIEDLLQDIQMSKEMEVDLELNADREQLPDKLKVQIYRIVQEFVSNTLKHAAASKLQVHLSVDGVGVKLLLGDNGNGFDLSSAKEAEGIGLKNVFSRVKYLGGRIDVNTSVGQGCRFDIELPIDNH